MVFLHGVSAAATPRLAAAPAASCASTARARRLRQDAGRLRDRVATPATSSPSCARSAAPPSWSATRSAAASRGPSPSATRSSSRRRSSRTRRCSTARRPSSRPAPRARCSPSCATSRSSWQAEGASAETMQRAPRRAVVRPGPHAAPARGAHRRRAARPWAAPITTSTPRSSREPRTTPRSRASTSRRRSSHPCSCSPPTSRRAACSRPATPSASRHAPRHRGRRARRLRAQHRRRAPLPPAYLEQLTASWTSTPRSRQAERHAAAARDPRRPGRRLLLAVAAPDPRLRGLVVRYGDYHERTVEPLRRLEVPRGEIPVIVDFGDGWLVGQGEMPLTRLGRSPAGLHNGPAVAEHAGRARCMQIDLHPLGARMLLGVPPGELAHQVIALDDLLGPDAQRLEDVLDAAAPGRRRFDLLDRILLRRLAVVPEDVVHPGLLGGWWLSKPQYQGGHRMRCTLTRGSVRQRGGCVGRSD